MSAEIQTACPSASTAWRVLILASSCASSAAVPAAKGVLNDVPQAAA
jgi:hypothetical protein